MDAYGRHQKLWPLLQRTIGSWVIRKLNIRRETLEIDGPILLISNHVSAWDPLIVACCLPKKQIYFVASEHIFRLGLLTRLLNWLVAPIPRRKASLGTDTVKSCLRHLRDGHSVCLFAEGEQSWDGMNVPVFPATGKLVKSCGATLVTFRIEGGYLSLPRWGKGVRRGLVQVYPVGIYPPEQLKTMSGEEINALINRDIAENAWQRQRQQPIAFRGRRRAEGLETALYLCPRCRHISSLHSRGDRVFCDCGFSLRYTEIGFFEPKEPFESIAEWERWQRSALPEQLSKTDGLLFSDAPAVLSRIDAGHRDELVGSGELQQYKDRLCCAGREFPLAAIRYMAMVQANLLLIGCEDGYYQIRAKGRMNLRKYLEVWKEK
ncbi:MAG: 1-acyl-sn-glycerol-3-phosphate acyltransferase [Oscillospiraceae bacterium]|nr:1-acyl-sn-glycerol-3-phosphate acyltransferase [Oscillospiraceae bacterium]